MKNKILKSFWLLALAFIVFLANHYGFTAENKINVVAKEGALNVYFLDVGQGDSTFILGPNNETLLIDGGPDNKVIEELGDVLPFSQKVIDHLVLSHPHADHVGGLPEVLDRYEVQNVYMTGVMHTSADYLTFLDKLEKGDYNIHFIDSYQKYLFGEDLFLEFLAPLENLAQVKVNELNNTSIINRIIYKEAALMMSGDAEIEEEHKLLSNYHKNLDKLQADLYKVAHHGSKSSSTYEFLNAMSPKLAIISCGLDNRFYHPHPTLLRKLEQKNIEYWRTDLQGLIHCWTFGKDWKCQNEK